MTALILSAFDSAAPSTMSQVHPMRQLEIPGLGAMRLPSTSGGLQPLEPARLPTNTTTHRHAVHRWFNFIAGFSPEFVAMCCADAEGVVLLDPFAGCGTALVEAQAAGLPSIGFDPHPFFARIARAKVAAPSDPDRLCRIEETLIKGLRNPVPLSSLPDAPRAFLSKLFHVETIEQLLGARDLLVDHVDLSDDDMAFLVLSRVLDMCSRSQTDGIYKAPTSKKRAEDPKVAIQAVVGQVLEDAAHRAAGVPFANVFCESSEMMPQVADGSVGVVVTSPPYLNNFDFAEMTRMYLYFWGICTSWRDITERVRSRLIVNTTTALRGQRGEIQEHYRKQLSTHLQGELDCVVERLKEQRECRAGKKEYDLLVYPYFAQIQNVVRECRRVMAPRAQIHIAIADAALYGIHISTPQLIAEILCDAGFRDVACDKLRSRGHRWVLKKRDGSKRGLGEYYVSGAR